MTTEKQRAEDKVSDAERVVGDAAVRAGTFLARLLARTREEMEDIWAEAQSRSGN